MDKRAILAVAGSGKTYHICNNLDPQKKNLILAFTHENISNILSELVKAYGHVPYLTSVMTFDAFKNRFLLKPYEYGILTNFADDLPKGKGITTINPPENRIKKGNRSINNPLYINQDNIGHYRTDTGYYYCNRISKLLVKSKLGKENLIAHAAKQINLFFDCVYIDEFQDYRGYDFDLLMNVAKCIDNILLVGDYYQHSVSGINNSGKPYSQKDKSIISYDDFMKLLENNNFSIDKDSLNYSRRCSSNVCHFVQNKLDIKICGNEEKEGNVIPITSKEEALKIIQNDDIIKLVYQKAASYPFNAVNWSYSKGDTMDKICVILTKTTDFIMSENKESSSLSMIIRNKLYVALTRSISDVYLISSTLFKQVMDELN